MHRANVTVMQQAHLASGENDLIDGIRGICLCPCMHACGRCQHDSVEALLQRHFRYQHNAWIEDVIYRTRYRREKWLLTCHELQLVPPGLGVVHAYALDAAVRRSCGPEEVVQCLCHLGKACAAWTPGRWKI